MSRSLPPQPPARRRRGRWLRRLAAGLGSILLGLSLLALPMACTNTIIPPDQPAEPAPVLLLDHGRHTSLLLPRPDGGMTRYAYGDWDWYALRQTGPLTGLAALLLPTQGALGRATIAGPVEPGEALRELPVIVVDHWQVDVERSRARTLRRRLDRVFQRHAGNAVWNPEAHLRFVHAPEAYSYFHNSNHAAANWLRDLGCEVRGPAFASDWRVVWPAESERGPDEDRPAFRSFPQRSALGRRLLHAAEKHGEAAFGQFGLSEDARTAGGVDLPKGRHSCCFKGAALVQAGRPLREPRPAE